MLPLIVLPLKTPTTSLALSHSILERVERVSLISLILVSLQLFSQEVRGSRRQEELLRARGQSEAAKLKEELLAGSRLDSMINTIQCLSYYALKGTELR